MDKKFEFHATIVRCYTENEVLVVGIGDDEVDPENYIILSRLEEDPEFQIEIDDEIGLQTSLKGIEISGAISKINLKNDYIEISIKEEHVEEIGTDFINISFNQKATDFSVLSDYISNICNGSQIKLQM